MIQNALKKTFSPEFLNRIDNVMVFNSLGREQIFQIIDNALAGLMKRLNNMKFKLDLSEEAKDFVAEKATTRSLVPVRYTALFRSMWKIRWPSISSARIPAKGYSGSPFRL